MEKKDEIMPEWHADLSEKTLKYLKSEGSAKATEAVQEQLRERLREALNNLEKLNNKIAGGSLGSEDKEMYKFKIRLEKEDIAWLKKMLKIDMNQEEKENFKRLFPF